MPSPVWVPLAGREWSIASPLPPLHQQCRTVDHRSQDCRWARRRGAPPFSPSTPPHNLRRDEIFACLPPDSRAATLLPIPRRVPEPYRRGTRTPRAAALSPCDRASPFSPGLFGRMAKERPHVVFGFL